MQGINRIVVRPKLEKKNLQLTFYLSPQTMILLARLRNKPTKKHSSEKTKLVRGTFQLSEETERLLETLQRDSKDKGDKKQKGWFIDQALDHYVSKGGDKLFRQLEKDREETGKKRSMGWFVELALQKKYKK